MNPRPTWTTATPVSLALMALLAPGCAPPHRSAAPDRPQPPRAREATGPERPAPPPRVAEVRLPPSRPVPVTERPAGTERPVGTVLRSVPVEPQTRSGDRAQELHQAIRRRIGLFQRCIKTHRIEDRLRVSITVAGKTGHLLRATVTPSRPEAAPLARCVETLVRRIVLRPDPETPEVTVEVTIVARLAAE